MNDLATGKEKLMTLKEVADATGAAYRTVADYAQRAGWTQNGKITLLNENQVTMILEAMKKAHNGGSSGSGGAANLANNLQGVETSKSRVLQLKILQEKMAALYEAEIAELKPKAEYYNRLVDRNHLTNIRDTAKELGVPQNVFIKTLLEKKYLYRDIKGNLKPCYDKMEYFELKDFINDQFTNNQTFITVAGKRHFLGLFQKEAVE